jgi:cytochrome c553
MAAMRYWVLLCMAASPLAAQDRSFDEQIKPILSANCTPCHDAKTRSSGFSVDSAADVIAGGSRRGTGALIDVLTGKITPRMPFGKPPLSDQQIATISTWFGRQKRVKTGAWWAFRKPVKPAVPGIKDPWARTEIDRFVLAKLQSKQLSPSPEAPPAILLRRAFFDLIGLPPSPDEARAFLEDSSPDAYAKLVDRLLADPRFGERWGRHWLDLARYADTQGFEADRENYHMWRYRDYVIDAFNRDKPYDQFIREQLAGDEIPFGAPETRIATGFLRLGPRYQGTNAQEVRQMTLDEITATVSSVFLGVTFKCAQCHDHKYDPIPQKDFYRLEAFFVPLELLDSKAEFTDAALKSRMDAARADCLTRLKAAQQRFDDYQQELLSKLAAAGEKVQPAKAQTLLAALDADGLVGDTYVRKLSPEVGVLESHLTRVIANGVVPNAEDKLFTLEEKKKYLELLSYVDGTRGGRDMGVLQRELRRFEPTAHVVRDAPNDSNRPALPVAFVRIRGEFTNPGEWVRAGYPTVLGGRTEPAELPTDQFGNVRIWRMPLANWIASADNPTTARVIVNRIWQHLFGAPIVATPSDFGRNGAQPSNQALLDWMAVRFVENKWSIKSAIHDIMLSSVYRQTSLRISDKEQQADPENQLLWRQNRKRVEGDILRDSLLAAAGRLNPERGGPGSFPRLPDAIKDRMTIKNFPSWTPSDGPETRKRSVYVFSRRQLEVPFLSVMDTPVFQSSCERRAVSTTALQALTLLNDDFVSEQAKYFAARVEEAVGPDPGRRAERAFEIAFARQPDAEERKRSGAFTLPALCRILMNANEFVYVD